MSTPRLCAPQTPGRLSADKQVFKFDDPPLHDPCAVAYAIAPELFKARLQ